MEGMHVIEIGSVVRLNSGGPRMTVLKIEEHSAGVVGVTCCWFTGGVFSGWGNLTSTLFDVRILVPAKPEQGDV